MHANEARKISEGNSRTPSEINYRYRELRDQVVRMKMTRISQVIKDAASEGYHIAYVNASMWTLGESFYWAYSKPYLQQLHRDVLADIKSRIRGLGYTIEQTVETGDKIWLHVRW